MSLLRELPSCLVKIQQGWRGTFLQGPSGVSTRQPAREAGISAKNSGPPSGNLQNQGSVGSFALTTEARTQKQKEGEALVESLNCHDCT